MPSPEKSPGRKLVIAADELRKTESKGRDITKAKKKLTKATETYLKSKG